jgi:hypothetical protein
MPTITHENDYAVVRFDQDTPLTFRAHRLTAGRFTSRILAVLHIEDMREADSHPGLDYLHVEERTEVWDEEVTEEWVIAQVDDWHTLVWAAELLEVTPQQLEAALERQFTP